ncbi:hypothetical protein L9F63_020080, partial [Diploptera punctata]
MYAERAESKLDIELNLTILKYIGLWPIHLTGYKRIFYLCCSWTLVFSIGLLIVMDSAALVKYWRDIQMSTINSCLILVAISATGKIVIFLVMCGKHEDVVNLFKKNSQLEIKYPCIRKVNSSRLTIAYFILGFIMCLLWDLMPILKAHFIYKDVNKDDSYIWELPNVALYPYDVKSRPLFEITYICEALIGLLYSAATISADTFYISMIIHTTTQLKIL